MESLSIIFLIFSPLLLSIIFFLPIFSGHEVLIRRIAKTFATLHFLYALLFLVFYNPSADFAYFKEIVLPGGAWISSLGLKFSFALDSLSLLLVILTSLIVLLSCIASKNVIKTKHSFYYALIFMLQTAVLGVFCARDMFIFFMFWELELIPMYFLIGQWGDKTAKKSAMKFLLYTFIGSMFMLLGLLMLHNLNFIANSELTGDLALINISNDAIPMYLQLTASILLLIGFAVKMPIVPFHTWLPDAHVDAPTPVSIILASILLKMGAYGIIRFNMQLLPDAFLIIAPYLFIFAMINIIYTAFVAYHQQDLKRIIAYSSISNMGIVLLGLCSMNLLGLTGAYFQMISHGIIAAGLFMIVGIIYIRTKTRDIAQLGGLASVMPRLAGFAVLISMASIGVPLTMGFIGEFLTFFASFNSSLIMPIPIQALTFITILILIFSSCYILRFLHKAFYGNMLERWDLVKDITNHEFIVLFIISTIIIVFGILPMSIIDIVLPAIKAIIESFGG